MPYNPWQGQQGQQGQMGQSPWGGGKSPWMNWAGGQPGGQPQSTQPPPPNEPQMFMSAAPAGFLGLQGMQPGFSPEDFNQMMLMYALSSNAPQRIDQFAQGSRKQIAGLGRAGHQAIDEQAANQYAAGANQLGAQQRQMQAQQGNAFAAMGLAPSMFHANVVPQQQMDLASMLGGLRGQTFGQTPGQHQGLREQQFDRRMGLGQGVLNARNQLEQYYDSLMLQKYMADIAAQAQMQAANKKAKSDMFGDVLGLGGALIGGPVGGVLGDFLGGLFD